jgi:hypothetical protein
VPYSELNASTPSALTAITAYSRLNTSADSGSGAAPCPGLCADELWAKANATRALSAIGVTRATSSDQ